MIIDNYNIILGDNDTNINKMIDYFKTFLKIKDEKYIGIDFEFNRVNNERQIALFQINLETQNTKTIFMFYPPDLNKSQMDVLKKLLYSDNVIIHGGESLDMPYLFSEVFKNKKEILKFLKNVKDTKFLCEYYNSKNNLIENKCKIYLLLYQMNVIDNDKLNFLLKNEENMGAIWNIFIDVKKMSKELINYSAYDVLYLPKLLKTFPNEEEYNNTIPDITNMVLFSKYINFIDDNLFLLNKFNNFFIFINNEKILFNDIVKKVNIPSEKHIIDINYFKKFFQMIIKFIVYIYITNNYEYYVNKENKSTIKLNKLEKYINVMKTFKYGYNYLLKLNSIINLKLVKDILI